MAEKFSVRDQRKANHHWADNEVLDDFGARIGAFGYAVYMFICRYAGNNDGRCYKTQREIAETFAISMDTVGRAVKVLIDCGLIATEQRPGKPSIYLVLEVPKKGRINLPPTAATPTAHSGTYLPPTAAGLPPTAAGLPPTAAPNKEARLLQDLSQDLNRGEKPPTRSVLMIAQERFWEVFDSLDVETERNLDADRMRRLRIAAVRSGLKLAGAKEMLREHPTWRTWPYLEQLDSQQEIVFPEPERKPPEGATLDPRKKAEALELAREVLQLRAQKKAAEAEAARMRLGRCLGTMNVSAIDAFLQAAREQSA